MFKLTIPRRVKATTHATIREAQVAFQTARDNSGEGGSTWPDGKLVDLIAQKTYRVSYNARVWDGEKAIA